MPLFSSSRGVQGPIGIRPGGNYKPYALRQVITTGYVAAGYANSVAWQNVNSFDWASETTTGRGNLLTYAGGYVTGAMNRTLSWTIGSDGTGTGGMAASSGCNRWNHKTYTMIATQAAPYTMSDPEAIVQYDQQGTGWLAYVNGTLSTSNIIRLDMTTATWSTSIATGLDQTGSGSSSHWTETTGVWWSDSTATAAANGQRRINFATVTEDNPGISMSAYGNQKGIAGKLGYGYAGNEGSYNGGYSYRKYNHTTNSTSVTGANTKAVLNSGEENYFIGQSKAATLGTYTGAGQVLDSGKFNMLTDTREDLGTGQWYRGTQSGTGSSAGSAITGASSGCGTWSD